jgi:hypothetical protein
LSVGHMSQHRRGDPSRSYLPKIGLAAFVIAGAQFATGPASLAQTATAPAGQATTAAPQQKPLSREQIEALVAPIALYPDALLAQVLMASTYPLEIVQASRWAQANPKVSGKALEDAMQQQPWDASVKALVAAPQALLMLNDKLDWTQKLGDAFLAQQPDVLEAVQQLRARADSAGKLKSTKEQTVSTQSVSGKTVYVVQPANPQVVYVPSYDPAVVYGGWPYPAYPPYSYYPPGYVAGGVLAFGAGMAVGAALWGGCNWGNNQVNVNVNQYNNFNRTNISNSNWQHQADHRRGVPYGNADVARQFGRGGGDTASRDAFRGRIDSGQGLRGDSGRPGGPQASTLPSGGRDGGSNRKGGDRAGSKAAGSGNRDSVRGGFDGIENGRQTRQESARGASSRSASTMPTGGGARTASPGGGGPRGGSVGGAGGGGPRAGAGGGGGGPRGGGGGGGRGGGGRR